MKIKTSMEECETVTNIITNLEDLINYSFETGSLVMASRYVSVLKKLIDKLSE